MAERKGALRIGIKTIGALAVAANLALPMRAQAQEATYSETCFSSSQSKDKITTVLSNYKIDPENGERVRNDVVMTTSKGIIIKSGILIANKKSLYRQEQVGSILVEEYGKFPEGEGLGLKEKYFDPVIALANEHECRPNFPVNDDIFVFHKPPVDNPIP